MNQSESFHEKHKFTRFNKAVVGSIGHSGVLYTITYNFSNYVITVLDNSRLNRHFFAFPPVCRQWNMDSTVAGVRLPWTWFPVRLSEPLHCHSGRHDQTVTVHSQWTRPPPHGDCWHARWEAHSLFIPSTCTVWLCKEFSLTGFLVLCKIQKQSLNHLLQEFGFQYLTFDM